MTTQSAPFAAGDDLGGGIAELDVDACARRPRPRSSRRTASTRLRRVPFTTSASGIHTLTSGTYVIG
jgi:hypothetical protein